MVSIITNGLLGAHCDPAPRPQGYNRTTTTRIIKGTAVIKSNVTQNMPQVQTILQEENIFFFSYNDSLLPANRHTATPKCKQCWTSGNSNSLTSQGRDYEVFSNANFTSRAYEQTRQIFVYFISFQFVSIRANRGLFQLISSHFFQQLYFSKKQPRIVILGYISIN